MTVPLVVIVGLLLGGAGSSNPTPKPTPGAPLARVTVSAPAVTNSATVATCARVISALPLTLAGQQLRLTVSTPPSPSIVAWGDPPIVFRCGVSRPKQLTPALLDQLIEVNGVLLLQEKTGSSNLFTIVDRSAYVDVSVPSSYAQSPLGPIASAVASVLPAVCQAAPETGGAAVPANKLCTRRK